jgi:hypothetical protein
VRVATKRALGVQKTAPATGELFLFISRATVPSERACIADSSV